MHIDSTPCPVVIAIIIVSLHHATFLRKLKQTVLLKVEAFDREQMASQLMVEP